MRWQQAYACSFVSMASDKRLDLSPLDHRVFLLSQINEALGSMDGNADGGFANYIVDPKLEWATRNELPRPTQPSQMPGPPRSGLRD